MEQPKESDYHIEIISEEILEKFCQFLKAEKGVILIKDPPSYLTVFAAFGFENNEEIKRTKYNWQEGTIKTAVNERRVIHLRSINNALHEDEDPAAQFIDDVYSLLYIPIKLENLPYVIIELFNPEKADILLEPEYQNILMGITKLAFENSFHYNKTKFDREIDVHSDDSSLSTLIGEHPEFIKILKLAHRIAPTNSTVLIRGESGTGKEMIARMIHDLSPRKKMPFVRVNCAAIPENLLESELFGHEKGAFTGAHSKRIGKFERAHRGTIFLDEVGEITPMLQTKLLHFLQFKEFERLGGNVNIKINVRIIAATNKNLEEAIKNNEFREDLFYRLNVVPVYLPPLRERLTDIPLLVYHFISKLNPELNLKVEGISDEALYLLQKYHWPGNIRELENIIERAMVIGNGKKIQTNELPQEIFGILSEVRTGKEVFQMREGKKSLWEVEKGLIERSLKDLNWNQSKVARELGISRNHLRYRIKKYKINIPKDKTKKAD